MLCLKSANSSHTLSKPITRTRHNIPIITTNFMLPPYKQNHLVCIYIPIRYHIRRCRRTSRINVCNQRNRQYRHYLFSYWQTTKFVCTVCAIFPSDLQHMRSLHVSFMKSKCEWILLLRLS